MEVKYGGGEATTREREEEKKKGDEGERGRLSSRVRHQMTRPLTYLQEEKAVMKKQRERRWRKGKGGGNVEVV